jgi:hypothetical protein
MRRLLIRMTLHVPTDTSWYIAYFADQIAARGNASVVGQPRHFEHMSYRWSFGTVVNWLLNQKQICNSVSMTYRPNRNDPSGCKVDGVGHA